MAIGIQELILLLPLIGLWLYMLIDCLNRPNDKFAIGGNYARLIWILVIIFGGFIGALIYYFLIKRKGVKTNEHEN